ncbi:Methyltransferase small domain-containing protein [Actinomyces ruminicola]|uniref:Methyltransferase small domain-containing protein n=1 Tax=Actinomyces ruminicola TaxID=332524 RepID=A0A1H0B3S2_9ACTO|nr:methyltransferase [Actinomyces ruminicola]SDN40235.1 Methyltransferase small domain-containing protein [Actinomyces ruminicola]
MTDAAPTPPTELAPTPPAAFSPTPPAAFSPTPPAAFSPTPPPVATPEQAAALRADLAEADWGVDAVAELLGPAVDAALRREQRYPALRRVREALAAGRTARTGAGSEGAADPVAVLTALFMLGEPVYAAELDAALPRTGTAGARAMGLVITAGSDLEAVGSGATEQHPPAAGSGGGGADTVRVRAAVDLRPHEACDDGGQARWWVASDLGELVSQGQLAPDHVLGIGGAGLTLAALTPRTPVRTALDLGCGCGIQTLYLLRHADHVVATDISARALAFTAFNAALAGTDPERLELRRGSFLEPVSGRRFDLIATNPPFVITPPAVRAAGLPLMEYRDAGGPVLPTLLPALGEHLTDGGIAVMLGNWEHHLGQDWRERVSGWLPDGTDAWVIQREVQDPIEYATMWLRDGGTTPERNRRGFEAALGAWLDDFAARGVQAVGFGYVVLHRPGDCDDAGRAPWRLLEEVGTRPTAPLGPHVAASVRSRSRLAAMSDAEVAALHPVVAPDVTEQRHLRPGDSEPSVILLRQGGGFGRTVQADTALAALVEVADGELSVGQIATAVAALTGADAAETTARMVEGARSLLADGLLLWT